MKPMDEIMHQTVPSSNSPVEKVFNVHALRTLAVCLIVLVHSRDMLGREIPTWINTGYAGAHLFFVISGFIMVYITSLRRPAPLSFLQSRIIRIVPLYWLATLLAFGLVLAAPGFFQATKAEPAELLKSLFFIPFEKTNGKIHPLVFVGWSLNYEMFFYALFCLGLFFKSRKFGYSFVIFSLVLAVCAGFIFKSSNVFFRFYTDPILLEFLSGVLLGILYTSHSRGKLGLVPPLLPAVITLAWLLFFTIGMPESHAVFKYGAPAFLLVLSGLVLEARGNFLDHPLIQWVGASSYSIYLSHYYFTGAGIKLAKITGLPGLLLIPAVLALSVVAGIAVYRTVETPLARFLKRNYGKPRFEA